MTIKEQHDGIWGDFLLFIPDCSGYKTPFICQDLQNFMPKQKWISLYANLKIKNNCTNAEHMHIPGPSHSTFWFIANIYSPKDMHESVCCNTIHHSSNLKKWYKWIYLQKRNRLTNIESKLMVNRGEREGRRDKLGVWD